MLRERAPPADGRARGWGLHPGPRAAAAWPCGDEATRQAAAPQGRKPPSAGAGAPGEDLLGRTRPALQRASLPRRRGERSGDPMALSGPCSASARTAPSSVRLPGGPSVPAPPRTLGEQPRTKVQEGARRAENTRVLRSFLTVINAAKKRKPEMGREPSRQ